MQSKPVLDYQGLINRIESSGIGVNDKFHALYLLNQINYQRLMVYRYHFMDNGVVKKGTTIEDLFTLYQFDRELKFCIYPLLESFEMSFRSKVAYYLGNSTGTHGYLDSDNFRDRNNFNIWHSAFEKAQKRNEKKRDSFVRNHKSKYSDNLPIYKAIELFSLGELTKFYGNINISSVHQGVMSDYIAKEKKLTCKIFYSWLVKLTDIRNICAHYDILYNKYFEIKTIRNRYWKGLTLPFSRNNKYYSLFTILLLLKILTIDSKLYNDVIYRLDNLINNYSSIISPLDLNFPSNWKQEIGRKYV